MAYSKTSIASPDGSLSFLFAVFAVLMWFAQVFTLRADSLLSCGIIQIILALGALAASCINMLRGKPKSNINLIATFLLGFFPGIRTLMLLLAASAGFEISFQIFGLMYIIGSVFCFGVAVKRLDRPLYRVLGTLFIALAMLFSGLSDLLLNSILSILGGWCLLLFAMVMFYYGLSVMYSYYDAALPQGKSLAQLVKGGRHV